MQNNIIFALNSFFLCFGVVEANTLNLDLDPEFWPNLDLDPELCIHF